MPRAKRNRGVQSQRKRPALPDGDSETSMTEDERKQKLEAYLQDFDLQVKARIEQMEIHKERMISSLRATYRLELMKIPPSIRNMKLSEYYASGGKADALEGASKAISAITDAVLQNAPTSNNRQPLEDTTNAPIKTAPRTAKTKKATEPEFVEPPTTGRTLRSARKKRAAPQSCKSKAKQPKTETTMPPLSTAGRATRKNAKVTDPFLTPAPGQPFANMSQTPFVTPKFDPRLPVTPALLREAKAGERIMSMSGSPLANMVTSRIPQVLVPAGDGKSLQFTTANSPSQVPQLNDEARKNLLLLQEQLQKILQVGKKK